MTHEELNSQSAPQSDNGSDWDQLSQEANQPQEQNLSPEEIRRHEDEEPEVPGHETGEYPENDQEQIREMAESPEHTLTREELEQLRGKDAA